MLCSLSKRLAKPCCAWYFYRWLHFFIQASLHHHQFANSAHGARCQLLRAGSGILVWRSFKEANWTIGWFSLVILSAFCRRIWNTMNTIGLYWTNPTISIYIILLYHTSPAVSADFFLQAGAVNGEPLAPAWMRSQERMDARPPWKHLRLPRLGDGRFSTRHGGSHGRSKNSWLVYFMEKNDHEGMISGYP